jgi:hypothetical protein
MVEKRKATLTVIATVSKTCALIRVSAIYFSHRKNKFCDIAPLLVA